MRGMEFRVWDTKTNYHHTDSMYIELDGELYEDSDRKYNTPNVEIERVSKDRYIIEQFTGRFDKNKQKIFEGDLVKTFSADFEENIDKIVFNRGSFELKPADNSKKNSAISKYDDEELEVVGHIH